MDLLNYIKDEKLTPSKLIYLTIIITNQCNLNCSYCFEKRESEINSNLAMSNEVMQTIPNFLNNLIVQFPENKLKICIYGGEPFVNKTELFNLLDIIKSVSDDTYKQLEDIQIVTNGTLLTTQVINKLCEYYDIFQDKLFVGVSIDSCKKNHDLYRVTKQNKPTFDIIINNVEELLSRGKQKAVCFQGVLSPNLLKNPEYIFEFIEYTKNREILNNHCNFTLLHTNDETFLNYSEKELIALYEHFTEIVLEHKNEIATGHFSFTAIDQCYYSCLGHKNKIEPLVSCLAGSNNIAISPDGMLYPCTKMYYTGQDEFSYGNISDIQTITTYISKIDFWKNITVKFNKCNSCVFGFDIEAGCQKLCISDNLYYTKSTDPRHHVCIQNRYFLKIMAEIIQS